MSHNAPARRFDLDWSHSDIPNVLAHGSRLPVGLSPDLRVLIINSEVFDITINESNGASESPTLTPFTIEGLPLLLKPHRHIYLSWGLECKISSCNSYVIFVSQGDQWCRKSRYLSAVFLYRIDLERRTSARVDFNLPEGSDFFDASFHPSLPLLAIRYALPTSTELKEKELNYLFRDPPIMRMAKLDIDTLKMTSLEIPNGQHREALAENWRHDGFLPRLRFSHCGTFTYLEGIAERHDWWFQIIHRMDINPVPTRFIDNALSFEDCRIVFHEDDNLPAALELITPDNNGFWQGTEPTVLLQNLASYSSKLAVADRYLLLGINDDEKMRLLIAPHDEGTPIIKTLSLTFAEARARLEKERQRLHAEPQG